MLLSYQCAETIATTAVIDSGATASYVSWRLIWEHRISTHKLSKPFNLRTVNGSHSKDGQVTDYCILFIKIDQRTMIRKFNITLLSEQDDMLLGYPWLAAIWPDINWDKRTIAIPANSISLDHEAFINR
jgi:hypothetical protein